MNSGGMSQVMPKSVPSSSASPGDNYVRRTVLSDVVAERLQEHIREHGLQPGDSLPTEQQLVIEYGVSRTVIREAARLLVQRGLVNVRPGRGMTVAKPSIEGLAYQLTATLRTDEASSSQLFELRELLEPAIAKAAAEARTEVDIAKLKSFLQRTEQNLNDADICVTCDIAFHQGLAEATHNPSAC
jgi:GntR family transcriptional regulator, transcriptional repressor for pyruvate dehydrogenase complex